MKADNQDEKFDALVARVFRERPVAMPELDGEADADDGIVELSPESLELVQAAGERLTEAIRRYLKE